MKKASFHLERLAFGGFLGQEAVKGDVLEPVACEKALPEEPVTQGPTELKARESGS